MRVRVFDDQIAPKRIVRNLIPRGMKSPGMVPLASGPEQV
jgi:hypothetical protein